MKIRKIRNYLVLFFLVFALEGFCQSAERAPTEVQKLENAFEQETISEMQLDAFEARGAQKLNDLAGYLGYVSDVATNETFRLQAMQLALELFISPEVSFKYYENGKVIDSTIKKYLTHLLKQKETKTQFEFINITKISETEKAADGAYTWVAQFVAKETQGEKITSGMLVTISISLQKVEKEFGSDTKMIWEVLLGEVVNLELAP